MNSEFQKSHPTKRTITANQVSFYVNSTSHRIWFPSPSLFLGKSFTLLQENGWID